VASGQWEDQLDPVNGHGDGGRLDAVGLTGLAAAPDGAMDRVARLVARVLDVPVAIVSLVEAGREIFPGQIGLPEPWGTRRQAPLSHSLARHVVERGEPLVVSDARTDERTSASPAIPDLGVVAYAGMPLTDNRGHVLGALCAIDVRPREWDERELAGLADLAAVCSVELRLRGLTRFSMQARREADAARHVAEKAQDRAEQANARAEEAGTRVRVALARSELLLRAAEDLADTSGIADVRRRVRDLVTGDLKPAYVGLALAEDGRLRRLVDSQVAFEVETTHVVYGLATGWPSARAAREGVLITIADRDDLVAGYAEEAVAAFDQLGLKAAACVPLPGARRTVGVLILGWDVPHVLEVTERAVLTAIAGYTAQAIERAAYLEERITVARELQTAMLTELPAVPGLDLAALYRPSPAGDLVGGDWYDAYALPPPPGPPGARTTTVAVTVGDITGHDTQAATVMGQIRAMLRQADIDHPGHGPAAVVTALERSCAALALDATGTLIHAHLTPRPGGGGDLTWTNAGHPAPLLALPDGSVHRLPRHDWLLWPDLTGGRTRTQDHRRLPAGSTLLMYTDGLVERRGEDIDLAIDRLAALLAAQCAPSSSGPLRPLPELIEDITDQTIASDTDDDIVVLALRLPR
jgi:serine phosphatase RsbU (regulator of sigma subunit)